MPVDSLAHVIQLSVAPVFLLTGLGAVLNVLASRLGRIVDRARKVAVALGEAQQAAADKGSTEIHDAQCRDLQADLDMLLRRARITQFAISLLVASSLLVALVVVTLFAAAYLNLNATIPVALLFATALLALVVGLLCFLREVHLAIGSLGIAPNRI